MKGLCKIFLGSPQLIQYDNIAIWNNMPYAQNATESLHEVLSVAKNKIKIA